MTDQTTSSRYSASDRATDELLVLHVLSGDQRAVDRLGLRWQGRLVRVARHMLGDEELAEIAAQEAWIGICRNWHKLNDPGKFSPWAFGILRRKCFDAVRKTQRRAAHAASLGEVSGVQAPMGGDLRLDLAQAFESLSPKHRTAATLYFGEALTLAEIAAVLDRPLGTIQSRIFHARKHLKAALSGDET